MNCYVDTDFISKIISLDMMDEFLSAYSITKTNLRIIQHEKVKTLSLIDTFHLSDEKKKKYKKLINSLTVITSNFIDIKFLQKLQNIQGIDSGEQILLFYLKDEKESICLTADHKFIKALISNISIKELLVIVKNRILILEQVIIKIIETHEFKNIKDKLFNGKECDSFLADILKNTKIMDEKLIQLLDDRVIIFKEILYIEE